MVDGELFELIGLGWTLPVRVKVVQQALYEVTLAEIPFLKKQRTEAEAALKVHCHARDGDRWYFSTKGLEQTAVKSVHTDPEDVVSWGVAHDYDVQRTSFHEGYGKSRYSVPMLRNAATFAIVWDGICKFMMHWLFAGHEVDLGFAKLNALPARANWREVVLGRLVGKYRNGVLTDTEKIRRETRKVLHQSMITAFDQSSGTVRWSLDVAPSKSFHDAAELLELDRKRKKGPAKYSLAILKLLRSHEMKDRLHEILKSFADATKAPCLALPHGLSNLQDDDGPQATPAPKCAQIPVVAGKSMADRDGFVKMPQASIGTPELQKLSKGHLANFSPPPSASTSAA